MILFKIGDLLRLKTRYRNLHPVEDYGFLNSTTGEFHTYDSITSIICACEMSAFSSENIVICLVALKDNRSVLGRMVKSVLEHAAD